MGSQEEKQITLKQLRKEFKKVVTKEKRTEILSKFDNKCLHCNSTERLAIDHITALSLGGTNDESNFQVLCVSCNSKKGGRRRNMKIIVPRGFIIIDLPADKPFQDALIDIAKKEHRDPKNWIEYVIINLVLEHKVKTKKK